jgi:hypothetical protein
VGEYREDVLRGVIDTRQNDRPVLHHLEIICEIFQGDFAIQDLAPEGHPGPVRALLQVAEILARIERFGEGKDKEHEHGREHYGV